MIGNIENIRHRQAVISRSATPARLVLTLRSSEAKLNKIEIFLLIKSSQNIVMSAVGPSQHRETLSSEPVSPAHNKGPKSCLSAVAVAVTVVTVVAVWLQWW